MLLCIGFLLMDLCGIFQEWYAPIVFIQKLYEYLSNIEKGCQKNFLMMCNINFPTIYQYLIMITILLSFDCNPISNAIKAGRWKSVNK
jgi:hypothetical protein